VSYEFFFRSPFIPVIFPNGTASNYSNSETSNAKLQTCNYSGALPLWPQFLFCLDTKKESKKVKAASASHEKLRLAAKIF